MGRKRKNTFATKNELEFNSNINSDFIETAVSNGDHEEFENRRSNLNKDNKPSKRLKKKKNTLDNAIADAQVDSVQLESVALEDQSVKQSKKGKHVRNETNEQVNVDTDNLENTSNSNKVKRSKRSKRKEEAIDNYTVETNYVETFESNPEDSNLSKKKKKRHEAEVFIKDSLEEVNIIPDSELSNRDDAKRSKNKKRKSKVIDENSTEEMHTNGDNQVVVNEMSDGCSVSKKKKKRQGKVIEQNLSIEEVNESSDYNTKKSKKRHIKIYDEIVVENLAVEMNVKADGVKQSRKKKRLNEAVNDDANAKVGTNHEIEIDLLNQDGVKRSNRKKKSKESFAEVFIKDLDDANVEETVVSKRSTRKKIRNNSCDVANENVEKSLKTRKNCEDKIVQSGLLPTNDIEVKPKRSKKKKKSITDCSTEQNEIQPEGVSLDFDQYNVSEIVDSDVKTTNKKKKRKHYQSEIISNLDESSTSASKLEQRISRHVHFNPNFHYNDHSILVHKKFKKGMEELVEENVDRQQTSPSHESASVEELCEGSVAPETQELPSRRKKAMKKSLEPAKTRRSQRKLQTNQETLNHESNFVNELETGTNVIRKRQEEKENQENIENMSKPSRRRKESGNGESKERAPRGGRGKKKPKNTRGDDSDDSLEGDSCVANKKVEERNSSDRLLDAIKKSKKRNQVLREKMNQGPDIGDVIQQIDRNYPDTSLPPLMHIFENNSNYAEENEDLNKKEEKADLTKERYCRVMEEKIVLEQPIISIFKFILAQDTSKVELCYKLIKDNYLKRLIEIIADKLSQDEFERFWTLLDLYQQVSESFFASNEISQLLDDAGEENHLFESCLYFFLSTKNFRTLNIQNELINFDQLKLFLHPLLTFQFYLSRPHLGKFNIHSALIHFNDMVEEVEVNSMHLFSSFIFAFLKIFELRGCYANINHKDIIRLIQIFDSLLAKCKDNIGYESSADLFLLSIYAMLIFFCQIPNKPMEGISQLQACRHWTESVLRNFFKNSHFDFIKESMFSNFSRFIFLLCADHQPFENAKLSPLETSLSMLTHLVGVLPRSTSNYVPRLIFIALKLIKHAGFGRNEYQEDVDDEDMDYCSLSEAIEKIKEIDWSKVTSDTRVIYHLASLLHEYVWHFDEYHPKLSELSQSFIETIQLDIETKFIFETLKRMTRN